MTVSKPIVYVQKGRGPYTNTLDVLAQMDLRHVRGKKVLLKPNIGRAASPDTGIITNHDVVAAAVDGFTKAGAFVAIGESPIVGVDIKEAFEVSGITGIAKKRSCPLIELDKRRFIDVRVPDGVAVKALKVCPEVLEFDYVVSIPVMKMHMHTGVTLSVKNMKGCLWRKSKVKFHMLAPVKGDNEKPINIAIADMAGVLKPHMAIIDGTIGMEGLGPSAGSAKPMDVVVASFDPFAADAIACRLMGTHAQKIAHLRIGSDRGYGVIRDEDILVEPDNWLMWASDFELPPENLGFEFPGINVMDNQSCSACQSTLLLLLKRHKDKLFEYFPSEKPLNIAIGKGNADVPEGTICIGNCTSVCKDKGIFIQGCPPVGSEILKAVAAKMRNYSAKN